MHHPLGQSLPTARAASVFAWPSRTPHNINVNNVAPGIHTFSLEEAKQRIDEGWQFIAVNSELKFMTDGAKRIADGLGLSRGGDLGKY